VSGVGVGVLLRDFCRHECKCSSTASDADWALLGMRVSWRERKDEGTNEYYRISTYNHTHLSTPT
jgi:hypothetical protein